MSNPCFFPRATTPTHLDLEEKREKRIRSDFHWARVKGGNVDSIDARLAGLSKHINDKDTRTRDIDPHVAQVPIIQSTLSDTEDAKRHKRDHVVPHSPNTASPIPPSSSSSQEKRGNIIRPVLHPKARQFHLVKDSFLSPSHVAAGHGVRKRKSKEKGIALFTERHLLQLQNQADSAKLPAEETQSAEDPILQNHNSINTGYRTYKRPNASAAEVEWRAKTWQKPAKTDKDITSIGDASPSNKSKFPSYGDYSLELAMQLQEITIQETQNDAVHKPAMGQRHPLKYKPKHPGPRTKKDIMATQNTEGDQMTLNPKAHECEDGFVYDTYIRSDGPIKADSEDLTPKTNQETVGILIIEEDDEEAWEQYIESAESEKEWDTDEEDENGSYTILRTRRHHGKSC